MEKLIHNVSSNEIEILPFDENDLAQIKLMVQQDQEMQNAQNRRNIAKSKLAALGLDDDDLTALGL